MRFPWSKKQEALVVRCGEIRNTIFKALGDIENPLPKPDKPGALVIKLTNGRKWRLDEDDRIRVVREGKYFRVYYGQRLEYETLSTNVEEWARNVEQ